MKRAAVVISFITAFAEASCWDPTSEGCGTGPLDQNVEGADLDTCLAIQGPPLDTSASQGQMPQFCQFISDTTNTRCCTTSHDIHIKNYVQGLWPDECSKNEYPGLNKLVCLACSPEQPKYAYEGPDGKKIIRICESLLREFYGNENMDQPTDAFEKCGAWSSPDTTLDPVS